MKDQMEVKINQGNNLKWMNGSIIQPIDKKKDENLNEAVKEDQPLEYFTE